MPSVREHGGHVVAAKGPTGTPFDYLLPQLKDRPGSHLPGAPKKVVDASTRWARALAGVATAGSIARTPSLRHRPMIETRTPPRRARCVQ